VCVRPAATTRRISLGGEGNALYPVLSSLSLYRIFYITRMSIVLGRVLESFDLLLSSSILEVKDKCKDKYSNRHKHACSRKSLCVYLYTSSVYFVKSFILPHEAQHDSAVGLSSACSSACLSICVSVCVSVCHTRAIRLCFSR